MKEFKGTTGKWKIGEYAVYAVTKSGDIKVCENPERFGVPIGKWEHNKQVIADAGNTVQKCNLLPSELLAQRNELVAELTQCVKALESIVSFGATTPIINRAKAAIKKATE